jgi:Uma2 family endonuclease
MRLGGLRRNNVLLAPSGCRSCPDTGRTPREYDSDVQSRDVVRSDITVEEFLGMDFAVNKVELLAGSVYELADESINHNRVITNSILALSPTTRRLGYELFAMRMALKVDPITAYYPDLFVTGTNDNESELFCTKPSLIVEVLSPLTAGTDFREKRVAYQRIASMRDYLIVDPKTRRVHHHHRENTATWGWRVRATGEVCATSLGNLEIDDLFIGLTPTEAQLDL